MNGIAIGAIISGAICVVFCFFGNIELWRLRNVPSIRATLPVINIMINISYILNAISTAYHVVTNSEACIAYLWLTFIQVILMMTGYLLKVLQIYVFAVISEKLIEDLKTTVQEDIKTIDKLQEDENIQTTEVAVQPVPPVKKSKCFSIDELVTEREYIGSKDFLVKCFFVIVGVALIVPLLINLTEKQYYQPTALCSDRTVGDIIGLSVIIIIGVVAFLFLLFKLRNTRDAYGIKSQIIGICFTWIIIAIITSLSGLKSPIMKGIWKIFSPGSLLLLPLYRAYKTLGFKGSLSTSETQSEVEELATNASSSNSTGGSSRRRMRVRNLSELKNKMNFYSLVHYVNADRKAIGFDSIYSFCIQLDISSGHNDYYYRNALLFVREYDLKKKELENETIEKQTKQFTNVLILYQKYMADGTAELDHGRTALSTVLVEEELLKKLQTTLNEAVKKDDYKSEDPIETMQLIYENMMKETIAYVYKSYVLSNYFDAFMKQFNADQQLKTLAMESV